MRAKDAAAFFLDEEINDELLTSESFNQKLNSYYEENSRRFEHNREKYGDQFNDLEIISEMYRVYIVVVQYTDDVVFCTGKNYHEKSENVIVISCDESRLTFKPLVPIFEEINSRRKLKPLCLISGTAMTVFASKKNSNDRTRRLCAVQINTILQNHRLHQLTYYER